MQGVMVRGDEEDLLRRAFAAWFRYCGDMPVQPSSSSRVTSHAGRQYVILTNNYDNVLAVYRVLPSFKLKKLRRWPKGVED